MVSHRPVEIDYFVNQVTAAEILGVTPMTIRRWMSAGKLEAVIVGGYRMLTRTEVDRLKREMTEAVESE